MIKDETLPPKYSFKVHWEKDKRLGVVAAVVRPDGGIHLLQETIDPPKRPWVGLTDKEIEECWDGDLSPYKMQCIREIEARLKEKNT